MAKRIDHSLLIRDCLSRHRHAVVTLKNVSFTMVAQRYSKRVSGQSTPSEADKIYCVWQDELGRQHDHLSIESLQFVCAL